MKANQELKNGTTQKKSKKENARDIISKSVQKVCGRKNGTIEKIYSEKLGFTIGYSIGSKLEHLKNQFGYQLILKDPAAREIQSTIKKRKRKTLWI